MEIAFTAFELQFLAMCAERRQINNEVLKKQSKKYDRNKTEYELNYIGAMGELAACKVTHSKIDTNLYEDGDDGVDLVVGGLEAQVKTFTFTGKNIDFFIDDMSQFTTPVCIGVQVLSPVRVRIMGWIEKEEFAAIAERKSYGYGQRLFVPGEKLHDIKEL